ncbi:hypothetical protein [Rathayibacter sp. VKM Ac-2630]|uniref:hypothetical protein n=1 Tax=Rathayibacter sp. VKM Ac-2630 TaxID=1938617 RepID=UPI0009818A48|nr:hypothetical protein [Rathayibacter sp. VKM Ac-2630]OOB90720.1 hypothetical protein B0T42_09945 [Rathayibacter sp. VKM Ac-2630]
MTGATVRRGDRVQIGKGTSVYLVDRVEDRKDEAGGVYQVAFLVTEKGRPLPGFTETARLRLVIRR